METIQDTAKLLVATGRGILAADESTGTANKRLKSVGAPETADMRRLYRELFITTPHVERYLSGIILYDETIRDVMTDGRLFTEVLQDKNILIGIKVDEGTVAFGDGEEVTEGLHGLSDRLEEYAAMGAAFAKWRAVIHIQGDRLPTREAIEENCIRLAQYAKACQKAGIVPVLEPEVLKEGDHTRARAAEVITETLDVLMEKVAAEEVDPTAMLIKSSMAVSGNESACTDKPEFVAEDTLEAFHESVSKEVPGIVFLSGGQESQEATCNLNAIACTGAQPWELSFSYARALQQEALHVWKGKEENVEKAQKVFLKRLELVTRARDGLYREEMEDDLKQILTT